MRRLSLTVLVARVAHRACRKFEQLPEFLTHDALSGPARPQRETRTVFPDFERYAYDMVCIGEVLSDDVHHLRAMSFTEWHGGLY
jgi:hypothetical protein